MLMGKQEKKGIDAAEFIILAMLAVQVAMIAYFNLRDIRYSLDTDFANTIYHYREVIKNGTLNLKGWKNTTSLELDAVFLFAWPLYYLVRDIFTAVGIANLIYVFLYIVTVTGIMKLADVERKYIFATLCIILMPHSFGMLEYFNMMFYGGSCYSLKTLVPLMCIWLILLFAKEGSSRKERILRRAAFCAYLFFLLITTFSTGIYVTLCGIIPILACCMFDIWKSGNLFGKYNRNHAFLLIGSVIAFLAGNAAHNKYYGLVSRTNMRLTKIENYAVNFSACVRGIFDLFGATLSEDVQALSVAGIWYCTKMAAVAMFVIVWFCNLRCLPGKREDVNAKDFLAVLPLFNFIILLIADSRYGPNPYIEYRYYLIGAVPMVLLFGIQMGEWAKLLNAFQKHAISAVLILALAVLLIGNNKHVMDKWPRTAYAMELCDFFNTLDVESVFFVDDYDTSHVCKGIDANHKYGAFISETQRLEMDICNYFESANGSYYGSKNAMAVFKDTVPGDYMPEQIAKNYQKIATVQWFDIYVSDMVWFP